jgi:hypothetical protein
VVSAPARVTAKKTIARESHTHRAGAPKPVVQLVAIAVERSIE